MARKIVKTNLVAILLVVIAVLSHSLIGNAGSLEPSAIPNLFPSWHCWASRQWQASSGKPAVAPGNTSALTPEHWQE